MGCSFIPEKLVDQYIHRQCVKHDEVYRNVTNKFFDKIKADIVLGSSVFFHGILFLFIGLWFSFLGILMGIFTLCFGWWAWRWRQGK